MPAQYDALFSNTGMETHRSRGKETMLIFFFGIERNQHDHIRSVTAVCPPVRSKQENIDLTIRFGIPLIGNKCIRDHNRSGGGDRCAQERLKGGRFSIIAAFIGQ